MSTGTFGKTTQKRVRLYHVYLFLNMVVTGVIFIFTRNGRDFGFGDWLINYEGGFVRRGFMGELVFLLGKAFHTNSLYFVALIGISCYAILFYSVWRLLEHSSWRWWTVALLISPATLAFQAISRTSFRKEVLFFAVFGLLINWLLRSRNKTQNDTLLAAYLSGALVILTLTHEGLVVYFPYLAAALLIGLQQPIRVARILALPALLCAGSTFMAMRHIGDAEIVKGICASLGNSDLDNCSGAVKFLIWTKDYAIHHTASFITDYHYYRNYGIIILVALIPIVGAFRELWRKPGSRRSLLFLTGAICIAVPLSVGLFIYGFDWGRWIYIHVLSIFLLLMLIDERTLLRREINSKIERPAAHFVLALFLVAYATCWSMPGYGDWPMFGYISIANRVLHLHAIARLL